VCRRQNGRDRAREIGEGYKLFYSGGREGRNGVGIILNEELKQQVVDVSRESDRLMSQDHMGKECPAYHLWVHPPSWMLRTSQGGIPRTSGRPDHEHPRG